MMRYLLSKWKWSCPCGVTTQTRKMKNKFIYSARMKLQDQHSIIFIIPHQSLHLHANIDTNNVLLLSSSVRKKHSRPERRFAPSLFGTPPLSPRWICSSGRPSGASSATQTKTKDVVKYASQHSQASLCKPKAQSKTISHIRVHSGGNCKAPGCVSVIN